MRQYIRLCLSALLMLGISMTTLAEQTPAEAAAAAVIANPSQAPQIAADAVAKNPEHAAAIIEAVLAVCPECTAISIDPAFKRKCTAKDNSNYCSCVSATMAIINAVLMAVPSVTDDVVDAAKGKPGYDPDKVSPPGNKKPDTGTDSGGNGGGISP